MSGTPREIQLLKYKDDGSFDLDVVALQSVLNRDDVKDLPVVLFSVAGPFRTGKSFLLNYFLRYLHSPVFKGEKGDNAKPLGEDSEPLGGFTWRGGSERNTVGLLIWSEPIIKTLENGDKVAVLLMDTQGLFDSKTTMRDCSIIFALSTLLSSVQVYNLKENLQENHLQFLQLFTQYAKAADNGEELKSFQNLLFLIRDWSYYDTHPYGSKGGDSLVAKRFEVTKDLSTDMVELRAQITSSFQKISGFLLPHPGFNVLKPQFDGRLSDLEENFKTYLLELVTLLFSPSNLVPKKINGQTIRAKELSTHFNVFLELFKSNETPTISSMTKAISDISLQTAVNDARELYENTVNSKFGVDQLSAPTEAIRFSHTQAIEAAKALYNSKKKMGSADELVARLDNLVKELDEILPQTLLMNETKVRKLNSEAQKIYADEVKKVHGENLLCLHPTDLESVHNEAVQKTVEFFDSRRQKFADFEDQARVVLIENLKKKLTDLNHENEGNTRIFISEAVLTYTKAMETLLSKEYAVEDDEFLLKHQKFSKDATDDFVSKRNRPSDYEEDEFKQTLIKKISDKFILLEKINKQHNREAFKAAYSMYEDSMNELWSGNSCCYSKGDLKGIHKRKKDIALFYFHPHKSVNDDFQKQLLSGKIDSLYKDHVETNDLRNRRAERNALNEYQRRMDDLISPKPMWALIVPWIITLAKRRSYHEDCKYYAIRYFRNERCGSSKYDEDSYYDDLIWSINRSYDTNYAL